MRPQVLLRADRDIRGFRVALAIVFLLMTLDASAVSVRAAEPLVTQTPITSMHPGALIGRTNAAQQVSLAVPLKPLKQSALDSFLTDLYTPSPPNYRRYLTPQQFTQRFFDATSRTQVVAYLQSQDFTARDPGIGSVINATGSAAQTERAFNVALSDYRDAGGQLYTASDVTPALPAPVASLIVGVLGLNTMPETAASSIPSALPATSGTIEAQTTPCAQAATFAANHATYLPGQMATAYDFTGLYNNGVHGENPTIALVELSDYHDADVATYQACFGTNVSLTRVPVDGGAGQPNGEGEVEGDIEAIAGLAPSLSTLLVYDAPDNAADHLNVYQRIANDDRAPVVSNSWGACEQRQEMDNPAFIPGTNIVLAQMAAQGQSFFTAGGDSGSTACIRSDPTNHTLSVGDTSAQPYATVVGGTHLSINGDATYASEHAWNTMKSGSGSGAGGGGFSSIWSRPAWQTGPGTTNAYSNGMRETPDVAAVAETQWTFFISGS
ncbi:MAG: S53 family peptidase [Thermomicrobiales bacterium]